MSLSLFSYFFPFSLPDESVTEDSFLFNFCGLFDLDCYVNFCPDYLLDPDELSLDREFELPDSRLVWLLSVDFDLELRFLFYYCSFIIFYFTIYAARFFR